MSDAFWAGIFGVLGTLGGSIVTYWQTRRVAREQIAHAELERIRTTRQLAYEPFFEVGQLLDDAIRRREAPLGGLMQRFWISADRARLVASDEVLEMINAYQSALFDAAANPESDGQGQHRVNVLRVQLTAAARRDLGVSHLVITEQ